MGKALLKSAPARVTRKDGSYRIVGAAWGAPIASVEVQIDGGPWLPATIDEGAGVRVRLEALVAGLDGRRARRAHGHLAGHRHGRQRPAGHDRPQIANKRTYWESNGQITRRVPIA